MRNFIVVGGGQAGLQVCESLRREGFDGNLTLVSGENFLPYHRPPLSKGYLLGEVSSERLTIRPQSFFEKQNIQYQKNVRVTALDRSRKTVKLSDGEFLSYDKLALATGTRVRTLSENLSTKKIFYIRSLADAQLLAQALPSFNRVGIIGGGFIGLEAAAVCSTLEKEVILFEQANSLMARIVPQELAKFFENFHKHQGVKVELGTQIKNIRESEGSLYLSTDAEEIIVDVLIVGIGVVPNSELAAESGIKCENGILTNSAGQTSDENVFAAGDCAAFYSDYSKKHVRLESVQHAVDTSKVVGASMMNKGESYSAAPWFWSDQYDLKLQIAGALELYDDSYLLGSLEDNSWSTFYFFKGRHVGTASINRPSDHMKSRKLLNSRSKLTKSTMESVDFDLTSFVKKNC